MKKVQNSLTDIGIILSVMLLLQSCGVYYKNPINLKEAVEQEGKVKIRTVDGKTIRYKKITSSDDGRFYGTRKKDGGWTQIPLNQEEIMSVRLKNKKASTWATVLAVGVPITTLVILAATADFGIGCIWCGGY